MRLFKATPIILPFYQFIKTQLSPFIEGKWVEENNLHLTHKFIGEDNPNNWKIKLKIPNETIKIYDFGIFNNKILYMKANSMHINFIAEQLNVKNFIPHITLCRMKKFDYKLFKVLKSLKFSTTAPFEVYLYSSILTNKSPIYTKIYKY